MAALSHSESSGFSIAKRPQKDPKERERDNVILVSLLPKFPICASTTTNYSVLNLAQNHSVGLCFLIWMTFLKSRPISAMAMDTLMASSFNLLCHHVLSKWWTNEHKMGPSKRISAPP
jgi:hypothetical protein